MNYAEYLFGFDRITAPHWMFMPFFCHQPTELSSGILVMEYARWLLTNQSQEDIDMSEEGITALQARISSEFETGVLQEMVVQTVPFAVKPVEILQPSYTDNLEKGEKLRGEVVHTYIRLLANFVNSRVGRSVVGVLHDLPSLTNGKWPELFGQAPRVVTAHLKIILIPKCANDHWQLLVLNRELAQIQLFCSLGWTKDLTKDGRVSYSSAQ
jgi:hypothetical protein